MSGFEPIAGSASAWSRWSEPEPNIRGLTEDDQDDIAELLMGRKVVKADDEHLILDNGTVIKAIGHDGGCACNAGCYDLSVLNGVDNIITKVEFDYRPASDGDYPMKAGRRHPDDPEDEWTGYYRVFVYAENQRINLMQFDGTDGNGYYGTGFAILVREVTP